MDIDGCVKIVRKSAFLNKGDICQKVLNQRV